MLIFFIQTFVLLVIAFVLGYFLGRYLKSLFCKRRLDHDEGRVRDEVETPSEMGAPRVHVPSATAKVLAGSAAAAGAVAAARSRMDAPDVSVKVPDIDLPSVKVPDVSLKVPDIDLPSVKVPDVSLKVPDIDLPSVKVPDVSLKVPDIDLPSIKVPDVSLKVPDIDLPSVKVPDVSLKVPDIDLPSVKVPDVSLEVPDIDLPSVKVPDVSLKVPDIDLPSVKVPDVSLKVPDIDLPSVKVPDIDLPSVKVPDVSLKVPDIDLPDVDGSGVLDAVKVAAVAAGAGIIGKVMGSQPSVGVPDVSLKVPDIDLPNVKVPDVSLKVPDVELSSVKLPDVSLKVPDVELPSIDVPDVSLKVPDVELPSIDVPDVSLKVPDIELPSVKLPDVSLKVSEVELPSIDVPDVSLKVPDVELPSIDVPDVSLKVPDVELPSIDVPDVSLKVPDIELPSIDVPDVSLKVPDVELPSIDVPDVSLKVPDVELPDVDGSGVLDAVKVAVVAAGAGIIGKAMSSQPEVSVASVDLPDEVGLEIDTDLPDVALLDGVSIQDGEVVIEEVKHPIADDDEARLLWDVDIDLNDHDLSDLGGAFILREGEQRQLGNVSCAVTGPGCVTIGGIPGELAQGRAALSRLYNVAAARDQEGRYAFMDVGAFRAGAMTEAVDLVDDDDELSMMERVVEASGSITSDPVVIPAFGSITSDPVVIPAFGSITSDPVVIPASGSITSDPVVIPASGSITSDPVVIPASGSITSDPVVIPASGSITSDPVVIPASGSITSDPVVIPASGSITSDPVVIPASGSIGNIAAVAAVGAIGSMAMAGDNAPEAGTHPEAHDDEAILLWDADVELSQSDLENLGGVFTLVEGEQRLLSRTSCAVTGPGRVEIGGIPGELDRGKAAFSQLYGIAVARDYEDRYAFMDMAAGRVGAMTEAVDSLDDGDDWFTSERVTPSSGPMSSGPGGRHSLDSGYSDPAAVAASGSITSGPVVIPAMGSVGMLSDDDASDELMNSEWESGKLGVSIQRALDELAEKGVTVSRLWGPDDGHHHNMLECYESLHLLPSTYGKMGSVHCSVTKPGTVTVGGDVSQVEEGEAVLFHFYNIVACRSDDDHYHFYHLVTS